MSDPFNLLGTTIAEKYKVERLLGEGGYGVVYAGEHKVLGEKVAIKCLKPLVGTTGGDERATQEFLKEARVLFSLSHPAIVRMYDVGELKVASTVVPYVILELVDGTTLEEEMQRRVREGASSFTGHELLGIFESVLDGLQFAHERGVIHRDLKPSNVMLVRNRAGGFTGKVLDFGTARANAGSAEASTGAPRFTPRYAAPEQWDPSFGAAGPQTDVFSIGLTLAEACTFEPAFAGTTPSQILSQVLNYGHLVSVAAKRPDLPLSIDAVIARATQRRLAERFPSMKEMRDALVPALKSASALPPVLPSAKPSVASPTAYQPPAGAMSMSGPMPGMSPLAQSGPFPPTMPAGAPPPSPFTQPASPFTQQAPANGPVTGFAPPLPPVNTGYGYAPQATTPRSGLGVGAWLGIAAAILVVVGGGIFASMFFFTRRQQPGPHFEHEPCRR